MALVERKLNEIEWTKPGTKVVGHLLSVRKVKYQNGTGLSYLLKQRGGTIVSFKGATKLNLLLHSGDLGKLVEVEYMGTDGREPKQGMSPAKIFRVSVDEDSVLKPDELGDLGITDDDIPF